MRCGPHGCGEHGGRRSRARRAVDAAPRQWHTVRGHRLSEKSELPRKPRCQAWHAPGGQDWRPSARLAGTAWREDRAALRAGRWARTRVAKPTRARQALRQAGAVETALTGVLRTSPHPHQLATPQKLTGYSGRIANRSVTGVDVSTLRRAGPSRAVAAFWRERSCGGVLRSEVGRPGPWPPPRAQGIAPLQPWRTRAVRHSGIPTRLRRVARRRAGLARPSFVSITIMIMIKSLLGSTKFATKLPEP